MGSIESCLFPDATRIDPHPSLRAFFVFEGSSSQVLKANEPTLCFQPGRVAESLGAARLGQAVRRGIT